jgi:flagellar hook assembly protein FlgD
MTPEILKSDVHLFPPRPAYRFRNVAGPSKQTNEQCAGKNPPYGAAINYFLKSKPKDNIKLSIYDENGKTVRTLKTEKKEYLDQIGGRRRRKTSGI